MANEDALLGFVWVMTFKWGLFSFRTKTLGDRVGSSKWPQDVIMSLYEFSQKGSSLGVKLHPLKQEMESGSYPIRAAQGQAPLNLSSGSRTDVRQIAESLSYPPSSTHLVLSVTGESHGH